MPQVEEPAQATPTGRDVYRAPSGLPGPSPAWTARGAGAKVTRKLGLSPRRSRRGQAVTQGCSWALRGAGRSGSKSTGQATHTAHQGRRAVPGASSALALGPDSEHFTIWPPLGKMRGRQDFNQGQERATPPWTCQGPFLGMGEGRPGLPPAGPIKDTPRATSPR